MPFFLHFVSTILFVSFLHFIYSFVSVLPVILRQDRWTDIYLFILSCLFTFAGNSVWKQLGWFVFWTVDFVLLLPQTFYSHPI